MSGRWKTSVVLMLRMTQRERWMFRSDSALCQRGRRMLKFKGELNGTQVEEEIRTFGLKTKSSLGLDNHRI
jgi:hypothetical protein